MSTKHTRPCKDLECLAREPHTAHLTWRGRLYYSMLNPKFWRSRLQNRRAR